MGQGVIGIECREDDADSRAALAALHHEESFVRLRAERAFAQTLEGSCHSPIAAHAVLEGGTLTVRGFVGSPDGGEVYRDVERGPAADTEAARPSARGAHEGRRRRRAARAPAARGGRAS